MVDVSFAMEKRDILFQNPCTVPTRCRIAMDGNQRETTRMMLRKTIAGLVAGATFAMTAQSASALDELTVAYFLEWPMPALAAKVDGTYEAELGIPIKWRSFETGTAMSAAMASGDVHISLSQGLPPFVVAASSGLPIEVVDVAVSYSENDNCVFSNALGVDETNTAEKLEGKRVAVPLGTAAQYSFLRQMSHFGVDLASLSIVDMPPPDGAIALAQGSVDFACGYGGGLTRMKESGRVLLTGAEKEEIGILVFDVTSTTKEFAEENPEMLSKFLMVTAATNDRWNSGVGRKGMLEAIAKESGMDYDAAEKSIGTMEFPSRDQQLTAKWFGGGIQEFMKGVAEVFKESGSIDDTLDSYDGATNAVPLISIKK